MSAFADKGSDRSLLLHINTPSLDQNVWIAFKSIELWMGEYYIQLMIEGHQLFLG